MAIYEFDCAEHGIFEVILKNPVKDSPCPECGSSSSKVFSAPAIIRVHHTEKLDYNDPLRVYDRQRMAKDTAVKKVLSDFAESQRYAKGSPYNQGR